jgi:predicted methyltransferase
LSSEKIWSNFANTEEGAEPVGLEVQEVKQEIGKKIEKKLFAMWISTRLSLQLAAQVRALHEPAESDSDADRVQKTWDSLRKKLEELSFAEVGGPEELVTWTLVGYLVSTNIFSDDILKQRSVFSDDLMQQGSVFSDDLPRQRFVFSDDLTQQGSVFSDDRNARRDAISSSLGLWWVVFDRQMFLRAVAV